MTPNSHQIQQVAAMTVVGCFAAFIATCWLLDLVGSDHLAMQTRVRDVFDVGVVSGICAFISSLVLSRSHRKFAITGLMACLLWTVWICLPRF